MAASRTDGWESPPVLVIETGRTRVHVAPEQIQIRRNGVEFWSSTPFDLWTEMMVAVEGMSVTRRQGSAVVVACEGDRHRGYTVSVLFLDGAPGSDEAWATANPTAWS